MCHPLIPPSAALPLLFSVAFVLFRPAFRFWQKVDEKLLHLHLYREFLLLSVFHRSTCPPVLRHSIPHERRYDNFTRRFFAAVFRTQYSIVNRSSFFIVFTYFDIFFHFFSVFKKDRIKIIGYIFFVKFFISNGFNGY